MAAKYKVLFEVTGVGRFPCDMLRYDSCWPVDPEDALKIELSPEECELEDLRERRTVQLAKFCYVKSDPLVTSARWRSFGWHVRDNIRVEKL